MPGKCAVEIQWTTQSLSLTSQTIGPDIRIVKEYNSGEYFGSQGDRDESLIRLDGQRTRSWTNHSVEFCDGNRTRISSLGSYGRHANAGASN